jgi:hypothetical protein
VNLRDRTWEKSFRRRVRQTLRAAPALWKEYRRSRPRWWRRSVPSHWLAVLAFAGLSAGAVARLSAEQNHPEATLAVLAFWFVGTAGAGVPWILGKLYDPITVTALYHLPLPDEDIFRARWRAAWRAALAWAPVYSGVGLVLAGAFGTAWSAQLVWLLLPAVQFLLAMVLALHLAAWAPQFRRWCLAGYVGALALLFGSPAAAAWLEPLVTSAPWIPPFGWLNHCVARVLLHGDWLALALLLPIAALVAGATFSWQRLRASYHLAEPDCAPGADETSAHRPALGSGEPAELVRSLTGRGPAETIVEAGWVERLVFRWWTPRERVVAGFWTAPQPGWSRSFRRLAWTFLPALAALLLFAEVHGFIVVLGIVLPLLTGAPLLGGAWRGLSSRPAGGRFSPMYALYPIGFWEAFRVMLKANCLRLGLAVPFALALAAAAAWRLTGSVEPGLVAGLKAIALWLGLQPVVTTFRLAEATNDTERLRLGHIFLLVPLLPVLLGGGFGLFLSETPGAVVTSWTCATGASLVLTVAYARGWARGRFDLLSARGADSFDFSE